MRFLFYRCNLPGKLSIMDFQEELQILIGKRIFELRSQNKQTQQDLEFITGIDVAEISKYEKGKRNLTLKTMIKLAIALKIHPKELLDVEFDVEKYRLDE